MKRNRAAVEMPRSESKQPLGNVAILLKGSLGTRGVFKHVPVLLKSKQVETDRLSYRAEIDMTAFLELIPPEDAQRVGHDILAALQKEFESRGYDNYGISPQIDYLNEPRLAPPTIVGWLEIGAFPPGKTSEGLRADFKQAFNRIAGDTLPGLDPLRRKLAAALDGFLERHQLRVDPQARDAYLDRQVEILQQVQGLSRGR